MRSSVATAGEHGRNEFTRTPVEGSFSVFQRGTKGVYQHCCGKKHLRRYVAEIEFRYNHRVANGVDDRDRNERALEGIVGKRLTYRRPDEGRA